jgi:predicted RNA polymerase sigma factor
LDGPLGHAGFLHNLSAEEALHETFRAALEQWPRDGVPANPRAWLVSAGRFKIIDRVRRQARFEPLDESAEPVDPRSEDGGLPDPDAIEDDRLRLIFTCCHPALAPDARIALTLREVCGLSTEEIARAFLITARPRWRSASCAPRPGSGRRASRMKCLPATPWRSAWMPC